MDAERVRGVGKPPSGPGMAEWRPAVGGLAGWIVARMAGACTVVAAAAIAAWPLVATANTTTPAPGPATAAPAPAAPLQSLPSLNVPPYMGTWYQVALFPNRFQAQCVSDTTATYRQLPDGSVEVANRCRTADGRLDEAIGRARPTGMLSGSTLAPAQLEVSFLPAWVRWLPVGWGRYWVIQLAEDGRYAVVSEPSRQYLWVLSRTPQLARTDEATIRARLVEQGFAAELARWQTHPQGGAAR
jgi:apolipoprotein D and lipocalin family protein